jgi:hypothetical protein
MSVAYVHESADEVANPFCLHGKALFVEIILNIYKSVGSILQRSVLSLIVVS